MAAELRARAALPVLLALCCAACALRPTLVPPQLSVLDVQVESLQLVQQRLRVRMHVENPNDRSLEVRALVYTLELEGQAVADGAAAAPFSVPARGAQDFDLEVTANLAPVALTLLARTAQGDTTPVAYRLRGSVSLGSGWLRRIPFDERGSFSLR